MARDYARIASKLVSTPWLITPEGLQLVLGIMDARMNGEKLTDEELAIRLEQVGAHGNDEQGPNVLNGGIGVLPIYGPIFGKANLMTELSGATSMEAFRKDLKAMVADPNIKSILLDIDSPGGTSEMIAEAGAEIFAARDTKPVIALANNMAGSAAYWLMSQASEAYSTPSGSVGSIGVYTVHEDQSGADAQKGRRFTYVSAGPYKTEGNPHEPLSAEGVQYRQEIVDELYNDFLSVVASGRGTTVEDVKDNYGGGRMLLPKKAAEAGMVDGIAEFDALVSDLASKPSVYLPVSVGGTSAVAVFDPATGIYKLESVDWEHSEPGTGSPPTPRQPESKDKAIEGGWRRPDLPDNLGEEENNPGAPKASNTTGGNVMDQEQLNALMSLFGVDNEEALVSAINDMHTEATALRGDVSTVAQERAFAEAYPDVWAEHQELRRDRLTTRASNFINSISTLGRPEGDKVVDTNMGLSALAMETVRESYMKFASGTASLEDFETAIRAITHGGVVEYGERGSTREGDEDLTFDVSTATGVQRARQLFASKVVEIQEKDQLEYRAAVAQATKQYPELAKAYRATINA